MENNNLLPVGTTLQNGKYRIKRQLASGGFGNTYEIYETQFEETFAMKEFYLKGVNERDDDSKTVSVSNAENTPEFVSQKEKFKKEALRLRKLDNPHVVRVYDLFEENETAYYVMDFLKGDSLSACMKKAGRPFSEQEVIDYTQQVLAALEAVHAENIWHLDLKPGNIMTDGEGKAVLIDFGASKQFHDSDGRSLSTSTGLCYTPGFAPTEQIESNTSRMGPWTDLYALGATMYNLLTMKTPPSVSDIQDGEGFDFPENVSPETQRMIRWLMEPNRKRRPQSVDEVWRFMERYFGLPLWKHEEQPQEQPAEQSEGLATVLSQQPTYDYVAQGEPRRSKLPWIIAAVAGGLAILGAIAAIVVYINFLKPTGSTGHATEHAEYSGQTEPPQAVSPAEMPAEPAAPVAIEEEPESPQPTRELIKEDVPQKKEMTKPVDVPVSHDHKDDVDKTDHVIKIAEQQTPAVLDENEIVHDVVEQMPSFPGGDAALTQYLSSNVKYPAVAVENGIQGRVVCKFVVERDGSITDVRVVKSVDPSLDKEAVRVIRAMPRWFPGRQNGAAVRVNYTVPVRFSLQ